MKLLVLSREPQSYSTRRLVEAGKKAGLGIRVVDHTKCSMVLEPEMNGVLYKGELLQDVQAVIPRIGASVTYYGTAIVRQFEMMQVFCAVDSVAISRSRDKLRSLQMLTRAGVNIPKTAFAKFPKGQDVEALLQEVGGAPVIIKLLEGTQGLGVVLAESKTAAQSVIEAFSGLQANILVQEFIKEAGGADIRAFVVDGRVVAAIRRQGVKGEFRSNLHRGGQAVPITLSPEETQAAIAAAKAMRLGIAGVDILPSNQGPFVIEVNSSPGLEGIETATGVDVAAEIIAYVQRGVARREVAEERG
ncbi:MAG: 30S ribosomal protein S6--L-glutamate ligase [Bacteroidetes bacterium]|jgi:ribosomal protein S6--L-glutamate ligase|nr:30S ribosomal protein S6--L-glutamate ligase [Bacteroidota bacterium]